MRVSRHATACLVAALSAVGCDRRAELRVDLLAFESSVIDLGEQQYQDRARARAVLRNDTQSTFVIESVDAGCTCTNARVDSVSILPGASATVSSEIDFRTRGRVSESVTIVGYFEGPGESVARTFQITAQVPGDVSLEPGRVVVRSGTLPVQRHILLHHHLGDEETPVEVVAVHAPEGVTVTKVGPATVLRRAGGRVSTQEFELRIESTERLREGDRVVFELDLLFNAELPIQVPR